MSLFISFEGGEGSGKTTQAELLRDRLAAEGRRTLAVREPGGTELGDYLRTWLKATGKPITPEAELFLFTAARSEVVRGVIRPALKSGAIVIADRYADSTTAYQGYGRRLPLRAVRSANELATDGLWPHLTVLLDAPPKTTLHRVRLQSSLFDDQTRPETKARTDEGISRRFEQEEEAFHRRVREGYLKPVSDHHMIRRMIANLIRSWHDRHAGAHLARLYRFINVLQEERDAKAGEHGRNLT